MKGSAAARDDVPAPSWALVPHDGGVSAETRVQRLEHDLEVARATIRRLAGSNGVDPLTGLHNREGIGRCLDLEIRRAERHERDLAVLLVDVDLAAVDALRGEERGDDVLRALSSHIRGATRVTDTIGRSRGDEFLIVCPETDAAGAVRVAEKLVGKTARRTILFAGAKGSLSVCIGVVSVVPGMSPSDVMQSAARALARAKKSGDARWSL